MLTSSVLDEVGNTPLIRLNIKDFPSINVFGKLEYCNPTGSIKDRAASYILKKCLQDRIINRDTVIIESSSGNFGVALASYAAYWGLKFTCVIDPYISPVNEMLIRSMGATVCKVDEPDENGGYLISRIKKVNELQSEIKNSYWINQYANPLNAEAYYESLGQEICDYFKGNLDYIFLGVSSGGTITGVSKRIKEMFPSTMVIAVDVYGSVIFGKSPMRRMIPGIGSSIVPDILKHAKLDDTVWVHQEDIVKNCRQLLSDHSIFAGGSSGAVIAGMKQYFSYREVADGATALCILPDRGERYASTIYDNGWCEQFAMQREELI